MEVATVDRLSGGGGGWMEETGFWVGATSNATGLTEGWFPWNIMCVYGM